MMFAALAAVISMSSALPVTAQEGAATPTPAPAKPKLICRTVNVTGSIMGKRECHPREVWKAVSQNNEKSMESYHNHQMPIDRRPPS